MTTEEEMEQAEAEQAEQALGQPTVTHEFKISGAAHAALAGLMRGWSGWSEGAIGFSKIGDTDVPPVARTDMVHQVTTLNPEALILNPNRVLNVITPFRLRQEAVLTGALLHEAAHVRYSRWMPSNDEEFAAMRHRDGSEVDPKTLALSKVLEEPRIEGWMAANGSRYGVMGLEWTMRAAALHLLPLSGNYADPAQEVMALLQSWILRAGRIHALRYHKVVGPTPSWVRSFDDLLADGLSTWLTLQGDPNPMTSTSAVGNLLHGAIYSGDHDGSRSVLIDAAKQVLEILFKDGDAPEMGSGCSTEGQSEPGDGGEAGEGSDAEPSAMGHALGSIEEAADKATEREAATAETEAGQEEPEQEQPAWGQRGGVSGDRSTAEWRNPTPAERDVQRGAERFLRDLIAPTESSSLAVTSSPSASIDAAAFAAWKAKGRTSEPRFFIRTRREVKPAPPVRIAILVDISYSMGVLQKPSALLSWALANAAVDLRNFAGHGRKVESCLIHWGSTTCDVIQSNGSTLPGIREVQCMEGTSLMHSALDLVEQEMPGFYDVPTDGEQANRLLVQFTDWELGGSSSDAAVAKAASALNAGVDMLTVTPNASTGEKWGSALPDVRARNWGPGRESMVVYDRTRPGQVWDTAATMLNL